MEIKFYCPRWGSETLPWDLFATRVKGAGYDGVEVFPLPTPHEKADLLTQVAAAGLDLILMQAEQTEGPDFNRYLQALERNLYELATYQSPEIKPRCINSHTGREYYTRDQMAQCFALCDRFSAETGIPVFHETHRHKWAYAAHVVQQYLEDPAFAALQLTLDFSHWVCVSESYLQDQTRALDLAVQHGAHLHARVGHLEGPQVTDPRMPENAEALQHHLGWWDQWIQSRAAAGADVCTITPEFGPPPYMALRPGTAEPLADQWALNLWMRDLLKARYAAYTRSGQVKTPLAADP